MFYPNFTNPCVDPEVCVCVCVGGGGGGGGGQGISSSLEDQMAQVSLEKLVVVRTPLRTQLETMVKWVQLHLQGVSYDPLLNMVMTEKTHKKHCQDPIFSHIKMSVSFYTVPWASFSVAAYQYFLYSNFCRELTLALLEWVVGWAMLTAGR